MESESKLQDSHPTVEELDEGIPPRFKGARFKQHTPERIMTVQDWRDREFPGIIFFTGPAGTGKTHLAYAVLRNERYNYRKAKFYNVSDLCVDISRNGSVETPNPRFVEKLRENEQVLILDDLGVERLTDWVFQGLYRIINYREEWGLPTLITSNMPLADIAAKFSDRLASRIAGGVVLEFQGQDWRLKSKKR